MRKTNRTKFERSDVNHGKTDKTEVQLSQKGWNKLEAPEYNPASEHPTPEQLLVREAVKCLTLKQRRIWDMFNFDRLTHDEIAQKLGVNQSLVTRAIHACERKITKWVNDNMGAYRLLKSELGDQE